MIVGNIEIQLLANIERLRRDMAAARRTVTDTVTAMGSALDTFKKSLAGIAGAFSVGTVIRMLTDTQREFDKLNASLVTATGSTAGAGVAFAALQRFAATTPFSLQEVTKAFVQLRNLGLTPSERALTSYGNTATAMGKSLDQMVEAAADAATGEFERLKEFGIRSQVEGDKVAFTFQGVTTSVANNAKAIEDYLIKLGETKFAGGMARQAQTLDGAVSNLADSWEGLKRQFSQSSGFGDAAREAAVRLSDALSILSAWVQQGGLSKISGAVAAAAKIAAAYFAIFVAAPAVLATVTGAIGAVQMSYALLTLEMRHGMTVWQLFNTTLGGTSISASLAAGAITRLQLACGLLFAAFAGWQIGTYLRDQFSEVRIAGLAFVGALLKGWEHLKLGASLAWAGIEMGFDEAVGAMKRQFASFLENSAKALRTIGWRGAADDLSSYAVALRGAAQGQQTFAERTAGIRASHEMAVQEIDKNIVELVRYELALEATAQMGEKAAGDQLAQFAVVASGQKQLTASQKKAAEEALSWHQKQVESGNEQIQLLTAELTATDDLAEGQKNVIKVLADLVKHSAYLTDAQKRSVAVGLEEALRLERLRDARKADQKAIEERAAAMRKETDEAWGRVGALEKQLQTYGLTEEQILRLSLAEYQRQAQAAELGEDEQSRLNSLIAATERQIQLQRELGVKQEATKFWTDIESTARQTFISIADGGKSAATRMKDSFRNIFFDWLYQMTIKKWIINVATSMGATGGFVSDALAQTSAAADVKSSGFSSIVSNVYSTLKGGSERAIAEGAQSVLDKLGFSPSAGAPGELAQLLGRAGNTVGGYFLGSSLNSLISGQYQTGKGVQTVEKIATAVASYLGGPLGGAIAGAIGGLINRAFGMGPKNVTGQGLTGTFTGDSFTGGQTYQTWTQKGGWFRSDKSGTDRAALDAETASVLGQGYAAIKASTAEYAKALGLSADAISGYSKAVNLALTNDAQKNQELIAGLLTDVGNELALRLVPQLAGLAHEGETASMTLQRLAGVFSATDAWLATFSVSAERAFGAVGIASAEARARLVELSGGIDGLAAQSQYFADNFLSKAEQIAPLQKQVSEQLSALGYNGLSTNDQYKAAVLQLVNSGALATEAGAKAYAGLLKLAPAFKTVADYMAEVQAASELAAQALQEQAAAAEEAAKQAAAQAAAQAQAAADAAAAENERQRQAMLDLVNSALGMVKASVAAQKDAVTKAYQESVAALEASISGLSAAVGEARNLSQTLKQSLSGAQSAAAGIGERQAAQAQIRAALVIAQAGGVLPKADALRDALAIVSRDVSGEFETLLDYQRDQAQTNNDIAALASVTDTQLSVQERQLLLLQDQKALAKVAYDNEIARLDTLANTAQLQVDQLMGVNTGVQSLGTAIASLAAALAGAAKPPTSTPGGATAGLTVEELYQKALGRQGDAAGLAFWKSAYGDVVDAAEIADFMRAAAPELEAKANGSWAQWLSQHGVPGFAAGGDHLGGWRIVGEAGPEIEYTGPSRITSNASSRGLMDSVAAEIAGLRQEMVSALSNVVVSTRKSANLMEQWDLDGMPGGREEEGTA